MQRSIVVILIGLLAGSICAQDSKALRKVRKALDSGDPFRAVQMSGTMLEKGDTSRTLHVLRADAYNRMGMYRDALEASAKAGGKAVADPEVLAQMMGAYLGLGLPDSALACVVEGAHPASATYIDRQAQAYQRNGDMEQALSLYSKGVSDFPTSVALLRDRGACYALMGDSAKARVDLDKAIELDPKDPVNYNHRGYYRYALFNEHEKAIKDMDRAIKIDPNYGYAFSNRGWSRYRLGDTKKAVKDLNLAARKNASNSYVHLYLGRIELEAGDTTAACLHFATALARGFTQHHGDEVQDLVDMHCPQVEPPKKAEPPKVVPSNAPDQPVRKGNAP